MVLRKEKPRSNSRLRQMIERAWREALLDMISSFITTASCVSRERDLDQT
jgi:hypothetical protein